MKIMKKKGRGKETRTKSEKGTHNTKPDIDSSCNIKLVFMSDLFRHIHLMGVIRLVFSIGRIGKLANAPVRFPPKKRRSMYI